MARRRSSQGGARWSRTRESGPASLAARWDDSTYRFFDQTVPARGYIGATQEGLTLTYTKVQEPYPGDRWITARAESTIAWKLFDREQHGPGAPGGIGIAKPKPGAEDSGQAELMFVTCMMLIYAVSEPVSSDVLEAWASYVEARGLKFYR